MRNLQTFFQHHDINISQRNSEIELLVNHACHVIPPLISCLLPCILIFEVNQSIRFFMVVDSSLLLSSVNRGLLVIDDIWDIKAWEIIKCALPKSDLGSRVIITTRITSVSEACCPSCDDIIHKMKSLDNDDSKRLFYKRIFPQGSECPVELEQVSREILKKCGGAPLAIITIASLLASNDQQIKPKSLSKVDNKTLDYLSLERDTSMS